MAKTSKKERSGGMKMIARALAAKNMSWAELGRQLSPPVSRQAISAWLYIDEIYIVQIEWLLKIPRELLRPDLYLAPRPPSFAGRPWWEITRKLREETHV